ncbi:MAG: hypothetical protein ACRC6A_07720 [Fusobacteriaceae bacterium]
MNRIIVPSKAEQLKSVRKYIFDLKKKDAHKTSKPKVIEDMVKFCESIYKIFFDKTDLEHIFCKKEGEVDYIIKKFELNISKNNHKKIVIYPDFVKHFVIPIIFDETNSKNIEV